MSWDALKLWDEDASRIEPLTGGSSNDVWSVRIAGRRAVARLGTRSDADLAWETGLLQFLDRAGLGVPVPIPARDGRLFADGLVVMTYVEGDPPETAADWRRVAETLRRLHALTGDWPQRPGWRTSTELLQAETGTRINLPAMPPEAVARCRAAWARITSQPSSVVHGNPNNPGNVRITADRVVLLDWDEARVDVSLLDLVLPHNGAGLEGELRDIAEQASAAWEAAICWDDDYSKQQLALVRPVSRAAAEIITYPDHDILKRTGTERQYQLLHPAAEAETALAGGQVNSVFRVGDTVRRAGGRDRSMQHALFAHLAAKGFAAAPQFLGHDNQGREVLTFLPGHVPVGEGNFSDPQLAAAARLLRAYHDATADFPPVRAAGAEVMCHNDWTPANTTFLDALPAGMIDFDTALPGTRLWDLTYSAWTWLDLGDTDWEPAEQRRRLELFVAAYDDPACTPALVALGLPARQAGRAQWALAHNNPAAVDWARQCLDWTLTHITGFYHPDGMQ